MNKIILYIAIFFISLMFNTTVFASDAHPIYLKGKYLYDLSNDVLDVVNQYRIEDGKEPLISDKNLTEFANYRAKETSINFEHIKLDGTSIFTAYNSQGLYNRLYSENVAWAGRNPKGIVNTWMNSNDGHREALLEGSYKTTGVGCYENNSEVFCVQVFSKNTNFQENLLVGTEINNHDLVNVIDDYIHFDIVTDGNLTINCTVGNNYEKLSLIAFNHYADYMKALITNDSAKWSSSDETIATVDENGIITGISEGQVNVTASIGNKSKTITVKVRDIIKGDINYDKKVTLLDIRLMLQKVVNQDFTEDEIEIMDYNDDSKATLSDIRLFLQRVINKQS